MVPRMKADFLDHSGFDLDGLGGREGMIGFAAR